MAGARIGAVTTLRRRAISAADRDSLRRVSKSVERDVARATPPAPEPVIRRKAATAITDLMGVAKHFHRVSTAEGDVVTMILDPLTEADLGPVEPMPPAPDPDAVEVTKSIYCPITKAEEEQRLVTGIVLQPEVVDAQGDIYSEDVIKEAAHNFLADYNAGNVMGFAHKEFDKPIDLCESYVAPSDIELDGKPVKKGTWVMTVKVLDDDIWEKVKAGKVKGFSIGGVAKVKKLDAGSALV